MFDQVTPSSSSVFRLTLFSILSVVPRTGLQQFYNNISVFILVCHVFMSSLLTKPLVQHHLSRVSPIQLRDFPLLYTSGRLIDHLWSEDGGIDKEPSCFGMFGNLEITWNL